METMMRLILDGLYCLVALCAGGFFVAMIYTDIKKPPQADGILPEISSSE